MDLQLERDKIEQRIQLNKTEVYRLMEEIKKDIKKVKHLDKLIKHATNLGLLEIERTGSETSEQYMERIQTAGKTNSAHSFTEGSDL
jgi:hypothetical protein